MRSDLDHSGPLTVDAIERATLAAVPPAELVELPGWLVAMDTGTVSRTRSAVPLGHAGLDPDVLPEIERLYLDRGMIPLLRLPRDVPDIAPLRSFLLARGYTARGPVDVMTGTVAALRTAGDASAATLAAAPDDAWGSVFLGPGFDAADGAIRVDVLRRGSSTLFAAVSSSCCRADDVDATTVPVAVGCGSFAEGIVGIHGMRTAAAHRRHGHARSILAAIGDAAAARGFTDAYLQVEAGNGPAATLYESLGFTRRWTYEYWTVRRD
jgi:GNAT superfamily N-acetyltransferase